MQTQPSRRKDGGVEASEYNHGRSLHVHFLQGHRLSTTATKATPGSVTASLALGQRRSYFSGCCPSRVDTKSGSTEHYASRHLSLDLGRVNPCPRRASRLGLREGEEEVNALPHYLQGDPSHLGLPLLSIAARLRAFSIGTAAPVAGVRRTPRSLFDCRRALEACRPYAGLLVSACGAVLGGHRVAAAIVVNRGLGNRPRSLSPNVDRRENNSAPALLHLARECLPGRF